MKIVQILLKSEVLNSEVLLVHLKNIESLGYVQISKYPCGASIFGDKTNCFIYNPNSMCLVAGFFACFLLIRILNDIFLSKHIISVFYSVTRQPFLNGE